MHPIKRAIKLHNAGWIAGFKAEGKYWVRKNSSANPCAVKPVPIEVYKLMLNMQYERKSNQSSFKTS